MHTKNNEKRTKRMKKGPKNNETWTKKMMINAQKTK